MHPAYWPVPRDIGDRVGDIRLRWTAYFSAYVTMVANSAQITGIGKLPLKCPPIHFQDLIFLSHVYCSFCVCVCVCVCAHVTMHVLMQGGASYEWGLIKFIFCAELTSGKIERILNGLVPSFTLLNQIGLHQMHSCILSLNSISLSTSRIIWRTKSHPCSGSRYYLTILIPQTFFPQTLLIHSVPECNPHMSYIFL